MDQRDTIDGLYKAIGNLLLKGNALTAPERHYACGCLIRLNHAAFLADDKQDDARIAVARLSAEMSTLGYFVVEGLPAEGLPAVVPA